MREILFRGKSIESKEGWVEGGYHEHCTRMPCPGTALKDNEIKQLIIRDSFADWNMPRGVEAVEVDPETVCQFTGLTDKNGKKIFEGDYVRMRSGTVRLVVFTHGSFGYFCSDEIVDFMPFAELFKLGYTSDDFEVAGNMFDNPEMNKKEEKNEPNGR